MPPLPTERAAYQKVIRTFKSCQTLAQHRVAINLMKQYLRIWPLNKKNRKLLLFQKMYLKKLLEI
jgi:hypothetical protein